MFCFQRLTLQKDTLSGSGNAGARFGTAISSMGDLNNDGYNGT